MFYGLGKKPEWLKRKGSEKRPLREIVREVFRLMSDGRERSIHQIAKELRLGWETAFWTMELINFIQRQPTLEKKEFKRKTFFRLTQRRTFKGKYL